MNARIRAGAALGSSLVFLLCAGCAVPSLGAMTGATITITADLDNVAGLYEGNEVAVLGMSIGSVESIEAEGTHVRVTMSVDAAVPLPSDIEVATISASVVTDRHIELTPAYSGSGPMLEDGAHVPISRTHTPVEIDSLMSAVTELSDSLSDTGDGRKPIADLVELADRGLAGNGEKIATTLDDLSAALAVGVDNKDAITDLVVTLSELTTLAAENDAQIRGFSQDMAVLVGEAGGQAQSLGNTIGQVDEISRQLAELITVNESSFPAMFADLHTAVGSLREHGRELSETIDTAPTLFRNLEQAIDPTTQALRVHFLTDRTLFDTELVNEFCVRIQMKSEGCRTGRVYDFGPDFGISAALLGLTGP